MLKATPQKSVVRFRALLVSVLMVLTLFPGVTPRAAAADVYKIFAKYDESRGKVEFATYSDEEGKDTIDENVAAGETVIMTYYPKSGYKVESVVFGELLSNDTGLGRMVRWHENERIENGQFVMPAHDVDIRIDFVPIDPSSVFYTLTIPSFEHGKVETVTGRNRFNAGELVQRKITPDEGY